MNKKKSNPNTHQMNQVASSAKNTQAQTSGGQNTNGQTAAAKQVKNCRTCGVLHSHILDCPHFLAVAASQRVNYMHSMRGCLACLTTNHSFDFKKRKEWFSRHEQNCDSSYVCTEGDCAKKNMPTCSTTHSHLTSRSPAKRPTTWKMRRR